MSPDRRSLWVRERGLPPLTEHDGVAAGHVDVAVVGAGLVGLSTAVMLAEAGCSVAVLEARRIGDGTTGSSTAKVSLLQGTRVSQIRERHGAELAASYVAGNRAGQSWLVARAQQAGLRVGRPAAVTYAARPEEVTACEQEHTALTDLGLPVTWRDPGGEVFPFYGGVALGDQAQLDPVAVLDALAAQLRELSVPIHENTRVIRASGGEVETARGTLTADRIVLATGIPFRDSGAFFARLAPVRSYLMALDATSAAAAAPGAEAAAAARATPEPNSGDSGRIASHGQWLGPALDMYLSAGSPVRSVRWAEAGERSFLLVGGNSHPVGQQDSERAAVVDLEHWARRYFGDLPVAASWSAQDYTPADGLPYVGPLHPGGHRTWVATGFAKWGMAAAPAAALLLSQALLRDGGSEEPAWGPAFRAWSGHELRGAGSAARMNAGVAAGIVSGRARSVGQAGEPAEGLGEVSDGPLCPLATSRVDGVTRVVSATCTHLGGVVEWNDAELSWDCPLHGSRFAPDGGVLEGPATAALKPPEDGAGEA